MKKSKYNIFVPHTNGTIVFNALSGSIGIFDDETLKRFNDNALSDKEISLLLKKGIVVNDDFDEMSKINADREEGIKDNKFKHFRIWPTSACNARCYYCFEKGIKAKTMSKDVADKAIKFIDSRLNDGDVLKIEWFGGEPLLNIQIMDYFYEQLKPICEKKHVTFRSSIISNGSLITKQVALKMKQSWNIDLIQITLDGDEETYNKVKDYARPEIHNFKSVMESIEYLIDQKVKVTVRMNYDTSNYESLVRLINYLHTKFENVKGISYYVYPLWSSIEENVENSFSSTAKADKNLLNLFDLLVENNMGTPYKIARLNYKNHACQAWSENSLTILADGNICKCCESYHHTFGNVENGITDNKSLSFWTNPALDSKCVDCVYLPLCQGGCKASHFSRMPQCFAYKPIFEDILKWYVGYLDKISQNK